MSKTKLIAAIAALVMAGSSLPYVQYDSPNTAVAADSTATSKEINLSGKFSEPNYCEFKQGSENNVYSLSIELGDDQGSSFKFLKFGEQIKEYDFDFICDDKNVTVQQKKLFTFQNGDYANARVYLRFSDNIPLGEYSFKMITKKAVDKNGKDVTSKFSDFNGKFSILDKDGKDTGRPDPAAEIIRLNTMGIARAASDESENSNIAANERVLNDNGYQVSGNINGKDHYFKELDYTVECDDKKAVVLEKGFLVEAMSYGSYFFYPTVKIRIPDDTPDGNYNCKLTVNKAVDLNGKDITDKLPTKTFGYYYVVKNSEGTTNKPKIGDSNGDGKINAIDASDVLNVYAKLATNKTQPTKDELACCDVNNDGKVNAVDASYVLSYYTYTQTGGTDSFADYMKNH